MNGVTPKISVILPFRNGGDEFAPALRSILHQTYENWELLLCDDGSTDGSVALARSIHDGRVEAWSDGRRKGLAARLNECVDRARGDFIARMDADDVSYPDRFRRQANFLLSHPEIDLVGCRMLIFGEDGTPLGKRRLPLEHEPIVASPALGIGLAHPTWMARARWFRRHRYDPAALRYEDAELLHRSHRSSRFANLPDLLYGYRELRGGFRKRFQGRLGRVRYLRSCSDAADRGVFYRAALAEAIKVVCDTGLAATSTRYAMLRLREERLSDAEADAWRQVFAAASQTGSTMASPLAGVAETEPA